MTEPVAATLVEQLVRQQHPSFAGPITPLASGWDNDMFRLGTDFTVRMPRRSVADGLILNEQKWLVELALLLPVPVPQPVAFGQPTAEFPWHWSICRWVPGTAAYQHPRATLSRVAVQLAESLAALHVPAPTAAPRNPYRGVPLAERDADIRERLTGFPRALSDIWAAALETPPWAGSAVWLHGDLHPANILVSRVEPLELSGLVDFGDLCAGDPSTDLAVAWLMFDAPGRALFRQTVAPDAATWGRARGWAVALATAFITGSPPNSPMIGVGHDAIAELLSDL